MVFTNNLETLIRFIEDHLLAQKNLAISEHNLIKALDDAALFSELNTDDSMLLLFQKHFLCMHVLYHLRDVFYQRKLYLHISPLAIYLEDINSHDTNSEPAEYNAELRTYYLDLENLTNATKESVDKLQQDFFKRYAAWAQADEAYTELELTNNASWREIQSQYRRLIQNAHPDKGGDKATFQRIQAAYDKLKLRHQKA